MQDWAERGIQVKGSACDVTCRDQRVELMKKVSSEFDGKLNILVSTIHNSIFLIISRAEALDPPLSMWICRVFWPKLLGY